MSTQEAVLLISNFILFPLMPGTSAAGMVFIDTSRQQRAKDALRELEGTIRRMERQGHAATG